MAAGAELERARERIEALALWKGELAIEPLMGGISNESWVVRDADGGHVVRFSRDFPFHHVLRDREVMTARAAHDAGFAPRVEYAASGVMVSSLIDARTYAASDVQGGIEPIAQLVRRFHCNMAAHISGPGFMFWPFHVVRDYARTLQAGQSRYTSNLESYVALAAELEAAQTPLPIVFAHNDLLPANFLDDGQRLWLIDFEYAGFSTAMFDLANLSSNAGFSADQSDRLLAAYFGQDPSADLQRSLAAMQCASLLREAMWSMVSELYLDAPGTDYVAYTEDNLGRLGEALDLYRTRYGNPYP